MTDTNDNMIFDRLADGELSPAERQQLLASLDSRPDGWRRCALAFVEAQVWRSDFKSLMAEEAPPPAVQIAATTPPLRPARPSTKSRWIQNGFSVAATALLAFGLGWSMRPAELLMPAGENLAANEVPAPRQGVNPQDAVTLVVQDERGQTQRLRLPLVDAAALGEQWTALSPEVPVGLRADLRDRGYDLKSRQRFAPLFFEQNKRLVPMVVPVSDTYVVPVESPVY